MLPADTDLVSSTAAFKSPYLPLLSKDDLTTLSHSSSVSSPVEGAVINGFLMHPDSQNALVKEYLLTLPPGEAAKMEALFHGLLELDAKKRMVILNSKRL